VTYTMYNPFGDAEEVHTQERAYRICADFVRVAQITLDQIDAATSVEDGAFATLDLIGKSWNHNVATIEQIMADPRIVLAQKRAECRAMAEDILAMASACSEALPPSG